MKKTRFIIGAIVVFVFAGVALYALMPSTTMYATLAEAKKHQGEKLQIYGEPVVDSVLYNEQENTFTVDVTDKQGTLLAVHAQGKPDPARMKEAKNLVIKGEYKDGAFYASEILYKCPSKYEKRTQ